jgi:hypothetical protein
VRPDLPGNLADLLLAEAGSAQLLVKRHPGDRSCLARIGAALAGEADDTEPIMPRQPAPHRGLGNPGSCRGRGDCCRPRGRARLGGQHQPQLLEPLALLARRGRRREVVALCGRVDVLEEPVRLGEGQIADGGRLLLGPCFERGIGLARPDGSIVAAWRWLNGALTALQTRLDPLR